MKFNAIILVIIYSTLSFILSISYVDFNISGGVYSIKYYLGRNEESSVIDQEKEGIKIRNETYRPELSPKFRLVKNRSYEFGFGIYTCFEYQDEIRLNDNLYTDIHFYGMGEDSFFSYGRLSFGMQYKINNELFSLVHQLKKNNIIDYLSYSFSPKENNDTSGKLYFGSLPDRVKDKKYKGGCNVDRNQTKWACELKRIKIGDCIYDNKEKMNFQSRERSTIVPSSFYNEIRDLYLKDFFDREECREIFTLETFQFFVCNCSVLNYLPSIEFTIDNYIFKTNLKYFINRNKEYCFIDFQTNLEHNNNWVFGTNFLNLFVSTFDYEKHYITFYSDIVIIQSDNIYLQYLILCIIIILLFGIAITVLDKFV